MIWLKNDTFKKYSCIYNEKHKSRTHFALKSSISSSQKNFLLLRLSKRRNHWKVNVLIPNSLIS